MKVYLDVIIITNFFYDFLIISSTSLLLKRNVALYKVIISSILGELSLITLFIPFDRTLLLLFKVILSLLIIFISFGKKRYLENLFYFYIITIILGGSSYLIGGDKYKVNFLLSFIVGPIIIYLYIKSLRELKIKMNSLHDVIIIDGNNTIKLKGYLDTGNKLVCPITKLPVIMVSKELELYSNKIFYVPYNVVNSHGVLKCIKVDKVLIDNKVSRVLLGLCEQDIFNNNISCILNNNLREMI